jgi:hypothetical protein
MSTPSIPGERTIEVIVSPKGQTRITARGYVGPSCRDATRALEQALGAVESDRPTAEMHEAEQAGQLHSERQ